MKVQDWTQRELKSFHVISLIGYYLLTFVFPIIYSACVISLTKEEIIVTKVKFPIIALIVLLLVLFAGLKLLENSIDKIQVLNLDGTYNEKAMTTKTILSFIVKALPVLLILGVVCIGGWKLNSMIEIIRDCAVDKLDAAVNNLKNLVAFYTKFVGHICSFYVCGILLHKTVIYRIEYEIELRNKVAENSAIQNRINNLTKINK